MIGSTHSRRRRKHDLDNPREYAHMRAELDSHADTCCFGSAAKLVYDTGSVVPVEGYKPSGSQHKVKIVCAAIAYDCPSTNHTYVLFFHQSLWIPEIKQHLLSTFQMRDNNVIVNDIPHQHTPRSQWTNSTHSIQVIEPPMTIPL